MYYYDWNPTILKTNKPKFQSENLRQHVSEISDILNASLNYLKIFTLTGNKITDKLLEIIPHPM